MNKLKSRVEPAKHSRFEITRPINGANQRFLILQKKQKDRKPTSQKPRQGVEQLIRLLLKVHNTPFLIIHKNFL